MSSLSFAHGVGRVFESPLPVWLYLAGAAGAVALSFVIQAIATRRERPYFRRRIGGPALADALALSFRTVALLGLVLTVAFAFIDPHPGFTVTPVLFWAGLVFGTVAVCSVIGGLWGAGNPWDAIQQVYSPDPVATGRVDVGWLMPPVMMYLLFWFELVSGAGFAPIAIVAVLFAYSALILSARSYLGAAWARIDPLTSLFSMASRIAPLRLLDDGLELRDPASGLYEQHPMDRGTMGAVFVVLASTAFDNARETVGWGDFLVATGIADVSSVVVDSIALALLTLPFLVSFLAAIWVAGRWSATPLSWPALTGRYAWSLIPIAVAYILAHNVPLLLSGWPEVIRRLSDLLGADVLSGYSPSPVLVWSLEIALIVGGHVLGVRAAHRTALELSGSRVAALKSQVALTLLMSLFTASTLWLLSLPLVAS